MESTFLSQNISPGLVENDILTTTGIDNNEFVKYMPRLKPETVAKAVVFAITVDDDVLVSCEIRSILILDSQHESHCTLVSVLIRSMRNE